jgi:hypothetical protein
MMFMNVPSINQFPWEHNQCIRNQKSEFYMAMPAIRKLKNWGQSKIREILENIMRIFLDGTKN